MKIKKTGVVSIRVPQLVEETLEAYSQYHKVRLSDLVRMGVYDLIKKVYAAGQNHMEVVKQIWEADADEEFFEQMEKMSKKKFEERNPKMKD